MCRHLELVFHTVAIHAVGDFFLLSQTNKHYVDLSMLADLKCLQSQLHIHKCLSL